MVKLRIYKLIMRRPLNRGPLTFPMKYMLRQPLNEASDTLASHNNTITNHRFIITTNNGNANNTTNNNRCSTHTNNNSPALRWSGWCPCRNGATMSWLCTNGCGVISSITSCHGTVYCIRVQYIMVRCSMASCGIS